MGDAWARTAAYADRGGARAPGMTPASTVDLSYRNNCILAKPAVLAFDKNVDRILSRTVTQANLA